MSRIGKQPIPIPEKIEVKIDGNLVMIKGPKGELKKEVPAEIQVALKDKQIVLTPAKETKRTSALWGLSRALLANMVEGVKNGFEKKLEIEGVGYKVVTQGHELKGHELILSLGFSHPVNFKAPSGIEFKIEKNVITVSGIDKELVAQTAANIRALKKPEPYKGKGIHYLGEVIKRKAGKKVVKSAF